MIVHKTYLTYKFNNVNVLVLCKIIKLVLYSYKIIYQVVCFPYYLLLILILIKTIINLVFKIYKSIIIYFYLINTKQNATLLTNNFSLIVTKCIDV